MSDPRNAHGAFCWTELMTTDPAAAEKFYCELFGWKIQTMKMQDGREYKVIGVGERQEGGITAMQHKKDAVQVGLRTAGDGPQRNATGLWAPVAFDDQGRDGPTRDSECSSSRRSPSAGAARWSR